MARQVLYELLVNYTKNLGDNIQSLAAAQFLPRIDLLIDRDNPRLPRSIRRELELLARSKAFIHPGYPEGFGIVATETLATGTPVTTYNLPPVNEIIRNHVHGSLIEKDDVAKLARSIMDFNITIYDERVLRSKAKKYDLRKTVESFHTVYKNLKVRPNC